MKCANCNKEIPNDAKFCLYCGAKLNAEIICPHCATKLPQESLFCSNCGKQVKEENTTVDPIDLGDEFMIGLYENFWADINKKLTEYCESKNLHDMVRILSRHHMSRLMREALENTYNFIGESLSPVLTPQVQEKLVALYEEHQKELSKNTDTLLAEMDLLGKRIKEEFPASNLEGSIKDFVGGFVKGAMGGWIGAAHAFLEGQKEEKQQLSLAEDWDAHVSALIEQINKLWSECTENVDLLTPQCAVNCVWDEDVLVKHLEEKSGVRHDLLPLLKEAASSSDFYFTPDIPDEKLGEAKRAYASLGENETVLCLFDSTLFGGADDGAVFTTEGIYWRELWGEPQHVKYKDLTKVSYVKDDDEIRLECKKGDVLIMEFSEDENQLLLPMLRKIMKWVKKS